MTDSGVHTFVAGFEVGSMFRNAGVPVGLPPESSQVIPSCMTAVVVGYVVSKKANAERVYVAPGLMLPISGFVCIPPPAGSNVLHQTLQVLPTPGVWF